MLERGIDLSGASPRLLTDEMANEADRAITKGCAIEDVCPAGLAETEDWGLEDPSNKPIERVREIRDDIERRVKALLAEVRVYPSVAGLFGRPCFRNPNWPFVRNNAWASNPPPPRSVSYLTTVTL